MRLESVLVANPWGIGDMIMSIPMLQALRRGLPRTRVGLWAATRTALDVVPAALYDQGFIFQAAIWPPHRLLAFARDIRAGDFDTAIVCTRLSRRYAQFLRHACAIPAIAGDAPGGKGSCYTHWRAIDSRLHMAPSNLEILRLVLPGAKQAPLALNREENAEQYADNLLRELGLSEKRILGVHPGSDLGRGGVEKRPPPEVLARFLRLFLDARPDSGILLLLGPQELGLADLFKAFDSRVHIVQGISILQTAAIIRRCRGFVAGCSGLGHIAAAAGVPVVTIAGPSDISTMHPWTEKRRTISTHLKLDCMPCYGTPLYGNCPYDVRCMNTVDPSGILEAVLPLF